MPLNHRHGACSPLSSEEKPTFEELLRRDQLRADNVQRKFSKSHRGVSGLQSSEVNVPTNLGSALDTLEYVIPSASAPQP